VAVFHRGADKVTGKAVQGVMDPGRAKAPDLMDIECGAEALVGAEGIGKPFWGDPQKIGKPVMGFIYFIALIGGQIFQLGF